MRHDSVDDLFYEWAVHNACLHQDTDLDLHVHWWSWRIVERWDEAERVAYEAWKYAQLVDKERSCFEDVRFFAPEPVKMLKTGRSGKSSAVRAMFAIGALAGVPALGGAGVVRCTHKFGLAGGFSSCSACGKRAYL